MAKVQKLFLSLLASALLLTGCQSGPKPNPSDTVVGAQFGDTGDWIDSDQVYSEMGLQERDSDFDMSKIPGGTAALMNPDNILATVHFNFDRFSLDSEYRDRLLEAVDYLKEHPNKRALVVGRTDWFGTQEYNLGLGDRRANSVRTYMVQLGIPATRTEIMSRGKLDATPGGTKSDSFKDRRADVILLN